MPQVALQRGYQLTMPQTIIEKANIQQDDLFDIVYDAGKITLVKLPKSPELTEKTSIMDFIGSMQGVYGTTPQEIDNYLASERQSWD